MGLSFACKRVPPAFELRFVRMDPGCRRPYDPAEWADALVVVEEGQLELECLQGGRRCFRRGDVVWLARLPLRALHNPGSLPLLLSAVSRRDEFRAPGPSEEI